MVMKQKKNIAKKLKPQYEFVEVMGMSIYGGSPKRVGSRASLGQPRSSPRKNSQLQAVGVEEWVCVCVCVLVGGFKQ